MIKEENKLRKKAEKIRANFEDKIVKLLAGMGKVVTSRGKTTTYLLKNNVIFGTIIDNEVHLIDTSSNQYEIVKDEILEDKDAFLMQATKSYFHVKNSKP